MEVGTAGDPHGAWGHTPAGTYIVPNRVSPRGKLPVWIYGIDRVGTWGEWVERGSEVGFWGVTGIWGSKAAL